MPIKKIKTLLRTTRLSLLLLTTTVPLLGYFMATGTFDINSIIFAFIGVNAHIFGFALNDYFDFNIDKNCSDRQLSPLVQGQISRKDVLLFALVQIPIAFILYIFILKGSNLGIGILAISIFLSVIYNRYSKQGKFPRWLAEFSLGLSIGLLFLAGVVIGNNYLDTKSIVFSLALSLVLLSVNSISSGLKDIKTDAMSGAESFVLSMGCRMISDDEVFISRNLWVFSISVQSIIFVLSIFLVFLFNASITTTILAFLLNIYAFLHIRMLLAFGSFEKIRKSFPLLNGFFNFFALIGFIMPFVPWYFAWLYWVGIVWLFSYPLKTAYKIRKTNYYVVRRR